MADVKIRQIRSGNGASPDQRAALRSLKLGKIGRSVEREDHPTVRGLIHSVQHLVKVDG